MATTLDDARIVIKIDATAAEAAAQELLKRRGAQRGGGSGGGAIPPIAPPVPGDAPEPADQPGGTGGRAAGIPGLVASAAKSAIIVEMIQAVAQVAAGALAKDEADTFFEAKFKETLKPVFDQLGDRIGDLENVVRGMFGAVTAAHEGISILEVQAAFEEPLDFKFAGEVFLARIQIGFAEADQRQSERKLRREFLGQAGRDGLDKLLGQARDEVQKMWRAH